MAMILKSQEYVILSDQEDAIDGLYATRQSLGSWYSTICHRTVLVALFIASLTSNIFLLIQCLHLSSNSGAVTERTMYGMLDRLHPNSHSLLRCNSGNLSHDFDLPWMSKSPYFGEDEVVADQLWEDISIDNGTVALDDSYVKTIGLPPSQRFPWDEHKGIYLLNGFHSMHCLVCEGIPKLTNVDFCNGGPNTKTENYPAGCVGVRSRTKPERTDGAYSPLPRRLAARRPLLCRRHPPLYRISAKWTLRHRATS